MDRKIKFNRVNHQLMLNDPCVLERRNWCNSRCCTLLPSSHCLIQTQMRPFTISYLSLLSCNEAVRLLGVKVRDWPSRLSGEGSTPPLFHFPTKGKQERVKSAIYQSTVVTRLPLCSVMREAQREGEKNGDAGYSSTAITCSTHSSDGMWEAARRCGLNHVVTSRYTLDSQKESRVISLVF